MSDSDETPVAVDSGNQPPDSSEKSGGSAWPGIIIVVVILIAAIAGCTFIVDKCTGPSDEEKAIRDAERKRTGQHCSLADYEGGKQIRANMLDPSSYEEISAHIYPVNNEGWHDLEITFRGTNRLGLAGISTAKLIVSNETCDVLLLSIE